MQINHHELLEDFKSGRRIFIKVFNLGENLGMDFAYFGHYHAVQKIFPNVIIDLYRSNVDETNCIGFDDYQGKAILPVHKMVMEVVKQRYPDGTDWCTKLNNKDYSILSDSFRSIEGYDYIWGIGYGSAACWQAQYPEETKFIGANIVEAAMHLHLKDQPSEKVVLQLGVNHDRIRPWERTALEHLVLDQADYPFSFTPTFNLDNYSDYLRVGLRWPDHVRWYYSIERQFEVLFDVIKSIRAADKPVKVVFTLKDGEIGNNFNRGQTLTHLKRLQDMCDDCIFTYSWTVSPYQHRLSEQQELSNLYQAGIQKVLKVDLWEDLLISSQCKTYLSDPGGFAEVICMLRPSESTFLFPTSFQHSCTYITLDGNRKPVNLKVNQIVIDQLYDCTPVLSTVDDPEGYRTLHWNLQYLEDKRQIGDNNHGDDWKRFEEAQDTVFRDWYEATHHQLVFEIVKHHIA